MSMREELLSAMAAAYNAARLDPFAYERQEIERLAALCRANYGGTLEQPEKLEPGMRWRQGVGWFTAAELPGMPGMVQAVSRLAAAVNAAVHGVEECDRILSAKHVLLLLERAQRACGFETLEETAARLTERQRDVILAMRARRAFEQDTGINVPKIMERMPKDTDEKNVKRIVLAFVADGTLCDNGKEKKHLLRWLSPRGRALADHLHYVHGTPL